VDWGVPVLTAVTVGALAWLFSRQINFVLGWTFRLFNQGFDASTRLYTRSVGMLLRVSLLVLAIYGGLLALTYWGFTATPTGFIPGQDKGFLLVNVQLPDSASLERTQKVMKRLEDIAGRTPGVKHTVGIAGQSLLLNANAPNFGAMYVMLDDFPDRREAHLSADAIADKLREQFEEENDDGLVQIFAAPPVEGLGTAGGFKIV